MNQTIFTRIGWWLCEKTGHFGAWRGGWIYNGQYHRDCKLCGRIISEDCKQTGAMMTDKELLKLAAKAAGYEVSEINQGINLDFEIFKENENYVYCHHKKPWNPLTDDGDALRLAVKLLFEIEMTQDCIAVRHSTGVKIFEAFNHDQYTATRRAIVRAAAEIGKRIKNELFELFKRRL